MKPATHLNRVLSALFLSITVGFISTQAAIVSRSGLITVSNAPSLGSAFVMGDVFAYTLSYDDAIVDADDLADYGEFSEALTSITIVPQTVRAGIWTPNGGFGNGTVYADIGAPQSWYFDAEPLSGLGPNINGYDAVSFAMGFGGLPINGDTGGYLTLGQVTGTILASVLPASSNVIELKFERGSDNELVTFDLTTFHAPEPGRATLLFGGLVVAFVRRRRR